MKHQLIALAAGVTVAVSSGQVFADDASIFGGPYIGGGIGTLGVNGTESDVHTLPPRTETFSGATDWGVMGTVIAGYDFKLRQRMIIGVFTDFSFSNAEFDLTAPDGDRNRLEANTAFNVGGRFGFLLNDATLLYATGGYSRAVFEYTYASGSNDQYTNRKSFDGWFVGAGAERKIRGPWSVKLEYRYAHYGEEQVGQVVSPPPTPPPAAPAPVDRSTNNIDADTHAIWLAINLDLGD